ncbi:hypothetical protein DEJ09_10205 [Curtobacterium sp. MCLR17_055]|nr:hypothetical protein DEJ09_10205 [Curtobacterium sp. MCLR17_055]
MHMSHKKRASTALKSMGAAGLAAATIVSGLSFGAPPAAAAPSARAATIQSSGALTGKLYSTKTGYDGVTYYYSVQANARAGAPVRMSWYTSKAAAVSSSSGWVVPKPGSTGAMVLAGTNFCADRTGSAYGYAAVRIETCNDSVGQMWSWAAKSGGQLLKDSQGNFAMSFGTGNPNDVILREQNANTDPFQLGEMSEYGSPLIASVTGVNNIAKTAVVGGTATPGAKVSFGGQMASADRVTGRWSMTVAGLKVGVNTLKFVQKINGVEYDSKSLDISVVEGGTFVGIDQGPVNLERGKTAPVPFVVENREARSSTKGTVTLNAPDGATFSEQDTIQGSWRRVGNTAWNASTSIPLTNGTLSNDNTTITFDLDWAPERPADQQYRFMVDVTTDTDAPEGASAMDFVMPGTSNTGDFRAEGSTTTTVGTSIADLIANIGSIDHAGKTAVISGTATPGAKITIGDKSVEADAETGAWSITVDDLDRGTNPLHIVQEIDGEEHDSKDLDVVINDAAISGQDGTAVTLERGEVTSVESLFKTNGSISRPQGKVEFTAPEGTTFAEDQGTIEGSFKKPGEDAWTNAAMTLTNGVRSEDGTKYTYDFATTTSTWNLPDASLMRWNINVNTPEDADAGTFPMRTVLSGTAVEGAFNTTSTTQATIEAPEVPAPDALVVTTPADDSTVDSKRPVFSGTGDEGATIEIRDADDNLIATTVVEDGAWSVPAAADLADGSYEFDVIQTPLTGAPSTEKVSFTVATNPLTTELTAVGAFDDDVTKPATISGDATTGATVIVKDSLGNEVGRTEAVDGKYSIPVPPSFAHTGVNDFAVTQTKNDTTSPAKDVSLDYGTPAPIRITSPENGSTVQKNGLTFTGTGDNGARIDVRGSVRAIATGTVTDGTWNAPVTIDLSNNVYNLRAVQTTKGGLTTQAPITITITDEAPVAPLTATAAFNTTDENLPATMTGSANPGATVTVKDSKGDTIGTAVATNGRYTITIPANKAHFGVNDFTVTQTVRGQVSAPLDRSLDYGNPAAPVIQTPANGDTVTNGSIRFTGTGATGAKLDMRGNTSSIGDTKITDGAWTVDVTRQLNPALYDLHALQTSKGGLTQRVNITVTVRNEQITALTANGTFNADVEQNATVSGNAQTGADVIVREGTTLIESVKAVGGKYSVTIPATVAGVRTFTVTQTVNGTVSAPKTATLDYGTPAALVIETPSNGGTVRGDQIVFTGTGAPGAKVVLNGTSSRLGSATVNTSGAWTISVDRTLTPQAYTLFTKQITKGNLNGPADQRTINVIR